MYDHASGHFLDIYLEVVKFHHAVRAEIAVANLVLWTIDARDLAADHRRDFEVVHFQRRPRKRELKRPLEPGSR